LAAKLLTIEEAAEYLRVSKTSLRRWTREGRLACERIGARSERRFRQDVLDAFLAASSRLAARSSGSRPAPSPGDALVAVEAAAAGRDLPRHISVLHTSRDEQWRLFRPFLAHHLKLGAPILLVHDEASGDDVRRRLREVGADVDALARRGLLRLLAPSQSYLRTGSFSADRMIDFMESAILDFRAMGHRTALISGEMSWFLTGAPGVDEMIPYEEKLNDLLRRHTGVTILCHYDVDRLPGRVTLGALCTHPHVQLADRFTAGFRG
jgi:excisionase family DNA binding protein